MQKYSNFVLTLGFFTYIFKDNLQCMRMWCMSRFSVLRLCSIGVALIVFVSVCKITCISAETEKNAHETVREGFYCFSETVDIRKYEILPSELAAIVAAVIKDDPYLFFVSGNMAYSYEPQGYVISLYPEYSMRGEEVFLALSACREKVKELAREASCFEDDAQKALYLHDRICLMTEYDATLKNDDLYDLFLNGKATCQGYAAAYLAVLRECGIECHFVASDSIEHIWSLVKLDGEWYHVDLTWDDSASSEEGRVSRRHFLMSDVVAERQGHKDWYSVNDFLCDDERYADCDFDYLLHIGFESGDADHDGRLTLADIFSLRLGKDLCVKCADLDGDGEVGESDVALIREKLLVSD